MTMRPLHIPLTPGLPDAGAPGQYLGRDQFGAVWLLRWDDRHTRWTALGWHLELPVPLPALRNLEDHPDLIVGHVEGPPVKTMTARPLAGFISEALAHAAADDPRNSAPPEPADAAPFWPAFFCLFGPAAAAGLIVVALISWGWPS